MADEERRDVPMARPGRPREKDAVRTTIVGGRPPGSGADLGPIPRGIEVLVKKAAVDAEFKALLLETRAEAAEAIGLELEPAEVLMLDAVPAAQLGAIIDHTSVSPISRQAFLGRAAGAMLAALGAATALDADAATSRGIRPPAPTGIRPPDPKGIRPDPVPTRFIVYREQDYKGDVSHHVLEATAYRPKLASLRLRNRWLKAAHAQAAKAWRGDPKNEGVPFPMKAPQPYRGRMLTSFGDQAAAEEAVKKHQEALAAQQKLAADKEAKRLAALSDERRKKEELKAQRLKAAHQLFEQRLNALLRPAVPVAGISPVVPEPGGTRGIRPDRP